MHSRARSVPGAHESTPEPAPFQELTESTPEPAPLQEYTESTPERPPEVVDIPNNFFMGGGYPPWPAFMLCVCLPLYSMSCFKKGILNALLAPCPDGNVTDVLTPELI